MEEMEKNKPSIGRRLKQYRVERDLTYEQVATLTGMSPSSLHRIENELVEPNERTIYKLTKALPGLVADAA